MLGCEKSNPSVHKNYSMLYSSHISWSSPTTPTPLEVYPALAFDADAVEFGAATHDLGKALHPDELTGPGSLHEAAGEGLLIGRGVPPGLARFCRTHGSWRTDPAAGLEDLLVALADTCWKGKRDMDLEIRVSRAAAGGMGGDPWAVLAELDGILEALAARAEERLARQGREG